MALVSNSLQPLIPRFFMLTNAANKFVELVWVNFLIFIRHALVGSPLSSFIL